MLFSFNIYSTYQQKSNKEENFMIAKFLKRLAILGLAFIVSCISQIEIGKAYFIIDLGWFALVILIFIAIIAIGGALCEESPLASVINFLVILLSAGSIAVNLGLSWIISQLFNIDFYTAYIVFDFILCLIPEKKKE